MLSALTVGMATLARCSKAASRAVPSKAGRISLRLYAISTRIPEQPEWMRSIAFLGASCWDYAPSQNLDYVPPCDTSLILGILDGSISFHQVKDLKIEILDLVSARPIRSDAEATAIARELFCQTHADPIASLSKTERNANLRQLHARSASIWQPERSTGIDRDTIQTRAKGRW